MRVRAVTTRIFKEDEDLALFIRQYLRSLKEGSIVVVTSKIVALAEGRVASLTDARGKGLLIQAESELAIPTKYAWLTVKDGAVLASAGIDESNADGKMILLPHDSFAVASALRRFLQKHYKKKRLGVLITDSRSMPLQAGVVGVAVGYAGFRGVCDYRGKKDLFGRALQYSRLNIANSLAAAAVVTMGEGDERRPLAIIDDADVEFCERVRRDELRINIEDDLYQPFFDYLAERH